MINGNLRFTLSNYSTTVLVAAARARGLLVMWTHSCARSAISLDKCEAMDQCLPKLLLGLCVELLGSELSDVKVLVQVVLQAYNPILIEPCLNTQIVHLIYF